MVGGGPVPPPTFLLDPVVKKMSKLNKEEITEWIWNLALKN